MVDWWKMWARDSQGADKLSKNTQNATKFICPNCLPKPKSLRFWWKKASLGVRSPGIAIWQANGLYLQYIKSYVPTAAPSRTWRRLAAAVHPNVVLTYIDILLRLRSSVTPDKLLGTLLYYYISSDQSALRPQFYIHTVGLSHILEHEFFCLGHLGSSGQ